MRVKSKEREGDDAGAWSEISQPHLVGDLSRVRHT